MWRFNRARPPGIAEIDARRIAAGISVSELLAMAGVGHETWRIGKRHPTRMRASTRRRLALAIAARGGDRAISRDTVGAMIGLSFRAFFRATCRRLKVNDAAAAAQLARVGEFPADSTWARASYVRAVALYLTNTALGVRQRDLARLTRLSPAALSISIGKIGDTLGTPFEQTLNAIERDVMGGG